MTILWELCCYKQFFDVTAQLSQRWRFLSNNIFLLKSSQCYFSIVYLFLFFRAGSVDALIVLATQSVKNDFLYQEAFIATYRTFVSTHDLLEKLVQRFRKFNNRKDEQQMIYKRVAHCAFSLMVSSKYWVWWTLFNIFSLGISRLSLLVPETFLIPFYHLFHYLLGKSLL